VTSVTFSCSLQEFMQSQWYCRQSYDIMQFYNISGYLAHV